MRNPGYNDHQDCAVCSDSVSVCMCQTQHCTSPFRLVLTQPQMAVRSTGGFCAFFGSHLGDRTVRPTLRPDPAFVFCQAPSLMTFATGGIPHDGSRHKWEGLDGQEGFLQALKCEPCLEE